MDVAGKLRELERKRVFLTAAGGLGTFGYLCLLGLLTKWSKLLEMEPNNVGDFLAGAFAPLAFLWLVIGYFLQAIELKQNSESLMQQAAETRNIVDQAKLQAQTAAENAAYARQQTINALRSAYERDLGVLAARIFGHGIELRPIGRLQLEFEKIDHSRPMWDSMGSGDLEAFAKRLVDLINDDCDDHEKIVRLMKWQHSKVDLIYAIDGYVTCFDDFLERLSSLGEERLAAFYLRYRVFGLLYHCVCELRKPLDVFVADPLLE